MDKQREKLIELLCNVNCGGGEHFGNCPERRNGHCRSIHKLEMCQLGAIADHILADEEIKRAFELLKAEKEGRLLETPCKVGDTVYRIAKLFTQTIIVEGEAYGFSITREVGSNSKYLLCFLAKGKEFERTNYSTWFDFSDFGKTVFLSREDAEKALENRKD